MSRALIVLIATLAFLGAASSAVAADSSQQFVVEGFGPPLNLFTSTAGPLCANGTMTVQIDEPTVTGVGNGAAFDLFGSHWNVHPWNNAPTWIVSGTTTFTCPNGSLTVEWHSVGDASDLTPPLEGRFTVVEGTGAYSGLSGSGAVSWDSTPVGFFFTFSGAVRSN